MKYLYALLLGLIFFLFSVVPSYCQSYLCKSEHLSVEDGLSNRFVRSILQDSKGFMWFATKNGLNRYDGYQFKVFTQKNSSIRSNFIDKIQEDADSNIWIGHAINSEETERFSAIDILNINSFEIQSIENYLGEALPCPVLQIYQIIPAKEQHWLYITTTTGQLYLYKNKTDIELIYQHPNASILRSFMQGQQYDWMYCDNELIALDKKHQIIHQQHLEIPPGLRCNFIGETNAHTIWIESNNQFHIDAVWSWDSQTGALEASPTLDVFEKSVDIRINTKFESRNKTQCSVLQSREYLELFDADNRSFYKYETTAQNFIRTAYIDNQENIWLGIITKGLIKLSYKKNKFKPYLKGSSTRSMTSLQADSVLLINSYGGQYLLNTYNDEQRRIDTLTDLCLINDSQENNLWLSAEGLFIRRKNLNDLSQVQYYYFKQAAINRLQQFPGHINRAAATWGLHLDSKDRLWLGTANGLAYIDPEQDSIQFFTQYDSFALLSRSVINALYENEAGLWIGSSSGLYLLDLATHRIVQHYHRQQSKPFQLPYDYILYIYEDAHQQFWLGTKGGGLIHWNPKTGESEQFTIENGLSHDVIYAILEDQYGFLWMSSDYGLMRMDPKTKVVNAYLPEDGLLHAEFNRKSSYKAPNGILYFGGLAGVVAIDPSDFLEIENYNPPISITDYQYFDAEKGALLDQTQLLEQHKTIELDYKDRFFILEFALLDFIAHEKNRYAYKIEGLDDSWTFINTNSIRINSLPPGKYTLSIKGEISNGLWSDQELHIPIFVQQPFYLTWQFWLLLVFLSFGLILFYTRWRVLRLNKAKAQLETEVQKRTEKIEQQANELRELDNVKSRFFANISHELRTPLTLMLGPIAAILEEHYGKDWEKIKSVLAVTHKNGEQLQNLIEEILELSKLEAQTLELEEQTLAFLPLIRRLFLAFEAQAYLLGIELKLDAPIDESLWVLLDENKFEKIINNLLSNALKYTPKGGSILLRLQAKSMEEEFLHLELEVQDSGKGIHPDDLPYIFDRFYQSKHKDAIVQGGTGIGLALALEFATLLGGELSANSQLGTGSTFSLKIPLKICAKPNILPAEQEVALTENLPFLLDKNKPKTHQILIVEDNRDMQQFLSDLLSPYYNISTALHGKMALELLEKDNSIDLIITDIMMPIMDGFELIEQIKAHPEWKKLPLIVLTARANEKDKLHALKVGVDDYLQKPFSRPELMARTYNLLQNYAQRTAWLAEEATPKPSNKEVVPEQSENIADEWLLSLESIAKKEVGNSQFGIINLAYDLNISERQLRRKIKLKTGLTPNQYLRTIKLDKARELLENRRYETVAEISYQVGFQNVNYFSKIYKEQYGKRPIEYLKP